MGSLCAVASLMRLRKTNSNAGVNVKAYPDVILIDYIGVNFLNQGVNMTVEQVAKAFALGQKAKCHNAETDGFSYWLHGNLISWKTQDKKSIVFDWCSWYGPATANHLNKLAVAVGSTYRVSYANARLHNVKQFIFEVNHGS